MEQVLEADRLSLIVPIKQKQYENVRGYKFGQNFILCHPRYTDFSNLQILIYDRVPDLKVANW